MLISKITKIKKLSKFQYGLACFGKSINTKAEILESPARAEIQKYKCYEIPQPNADMKAGMPVSPDI